MAHWLRMFVSRSHKLLCLFLILLSLGLNSKALSWSVPHLTYSTSTFTEAGNNIGAINNSSPITITVSVDQFTGSNNDDFVVAGKVVVSNLPAGLTVVMTRTSSTVLSVTISGTAASHAAANSISNLTFTFQNSAFTVNTASNVQNFNKSDLQITFLDPYTAHSLSFDGVNDVVSIPGSASINLSQGTWEAWVNVSTLSHHNRILFKEDGSGNSKYELYILDSSNGSGFHADVVSGLTRYSVTASSVTATTGTWYHVAATYDGTDLKIYVNGTLRGTTNVGSSIDANTGSLGIGGNLTGTPSSLFEGNIDEVRIWNTVRTQTDIANNMNTELTGSESGLAAYYNCNEGSGTTLYDLTSNSNNGTLLNGVAWSATPPVASLPVELAAFTASSSRKGAELKWQTATELDNAGWEIQRKAISNLGLSNADWENAGFVKGAGTSTSPQQYSFVDLNLTSGLYSYRLKQMDRNGTFSYSHEMQVDVNPAPKVFSLNQNYPNPFNPSTNIQFTLPTDGRVVLKVYDITGREVATLLDQDMKAGEYQQVVFDAGKFASGVYFSKLEFAGRQLLRKMVLLK